MTASHISSLRTILALLVALAGLAGPSQAQWPGSDVTRASDAAIRRGVKALEGMQRPSGRFQQPDPYGGGHHNPFPMGETALGIYTLCTAGASDSPTIPRALTYLNDLELRTTYDTALLILALDALRDPVHDERIRQAGEWLVSNVNTEGLWGYPTGAPDLSNSQLAILAVWAATRHGLDVKNDLWVRAINALVARQKPDGGFAYSEKTKFAHQREPTGTMTTAGITILLCSLEAMGDAAPVGAKARAEEGLEQAWRWLDRTFTGNGNPATSAGLIVERYPSRSRFNYHHYYYLYGIERIAALTGRRLIGGRNWYRECAIEILKGEELEGGWASLENTCLALLFLRRATYSGLSSERRATAPTLEGRWAYSTAKPSDDWTTQTFDDSGWDRSIGGFGRRGRDTSEIQTRWDSSDIWLRRWFTWRGGAPETLGLELACDDEATVYLNGVVGGTYSGQRKRQRVQLETDALETLRTGRNLVTIHARNTKGDQIVSAQLELPPDPRVIPDADFTPWFKSKPSAEAFAIRRWLILGPLRNDDDTALNDSELLDDAALAPSPGLRSANATWKIAAGCSGVVDFAAETRSKPEHVYYAFTYLDVLESQTAILWLGAQGGVRAYLDGETILAHHRHDEYVPDAFAIPLVLDPGMHRLLVKLDGPSAPRLAARLTDQDGAALRGVIPRLAADRSDDADAARAHAASFTLEELLNSLPETGKRGRIGFAKAIELTGVGTRGCATAAPRWRAKAEARSQTPQPSAGAKGLMEVVTLGRETPATALARMELSAGPKQLMARLCMRVGSSESAEVRLGVFANGEHWSEPLELPANPTLKSRDWHELTFDVPEQAAATHAVLMLEIRAGARESVFIDELALR